MSDYEYKYVAEDGPDLHIRTFEDAPDEVWVSTHGTADVGTYVPNVDVEAVALELLKAAGQESVIVPKAYEDVVDKGNGLIECGGGPEIAFGEMTQNPNWLYNRAANYVALAQYIEGAAAREAAEKAGAEAAEKKLQERRDALAKEYYWLPYERLGGGSRQAVDHIISLQDMLAAAK